MVCCRGYNKPGQIWAALRRRAVEWSNFRVSICKTRPPAGDNIDREGWRGFLAISALDSCSTWGDPKTALSRNRGVDDKSILSEKAAQIYLDFF